MVKLRAATTIPIIVLLLATGCTLLTAPPKGYTPENQQALEKLVTEKKYQRALTYLEQMQLDENGKTYKTQQRRITSLISNFEQEVVRQTTDRTVLGDYAGAIEIVDQALGKIPLNKKLLGLSVSLKKTRDKRLANTSHNLLLSKAEYLISQLEWHEEEALLEKPSFLSRWRLNGIRNSLESLHPDLITCARKALAARQDDVAERCLHTAAMIDNSAIVNQLFSQITSNEVGSSLVPLSEEKKIRPASATASSFLEIEEKLKKEIEEGYLLKAYETLTELTSFPGKEEAVNKYRQILDNKKGNRIAKHLKEGSDLYRNGRIAEAREAWRKVLKLEPNNHTANEKVARADKVLQRIEYLQKSQKKTPTEQ